MFSEHLDADCFEYTTRLGSSIGSKNLNLRLFARTFPTNQRYLRVLLVVDATRRDNDKRFVRKQDVATQTQWQETLEVYRQPKVTTCTDRAALCGKIVGIASGLRFSLQGPIQAAHSEVSPCIRSKKHQNTLNTDGDFLVKTFFQQLESKHGVICYLSGKHGNLYSYLFCFSLGCCNQRLHIAVF